MNIRQRSVVVDFFATSTSAASIHDRPSPLALLLHHAQHIKSRPGQSVVLVQNALVPVAHLSCSGILEINGSHIHEMLIRAQRTCEESSSLTCPGQGLNLLQISIVADAPEKDKRPLPSKSLGFTIAKSETVPVGRYDNAC